MKGKRVIAICLIALLLFVSGCSFDFVSVDSLMRAPKLTGTYAEIEKAFEESVGKAITLQSPRSGAFRTAFVLHDLDGDGVDEALVFYSQNSDTTTVHIHFLDCIHGEWSSVGDMVGSEREVYELHFEDLDGNSTDEIILNYNTNGSNKLMSVYGIEVNDFDSFSVLPLSTVQYQKYAIVDFDRDSVREIFYAVFEVSVDTGAAVPYARVLKLNTDHTQLQMELSASLPLQSGISVFSAISVDNTQTESRVYLDCLYMDEYTMITEVIAWSPEAGYILLLHKLDPTAILKTSRPATLLTQDIDQDGMMEIPAEYELPDSEILNVAEGMQVKAIVRDYYRIQQDGALLLCSSVYADPAGKYTLDLVKTGLYGKISCVYDCLSESTAFYIYDSVNEVRSEHLFTLQIKSVNGAYTAYYDIGKAGTENGLTPALIGDAITILNTEVKE